MTAERRKYTVEGQNDREGARIALMTGGMAENKAYMAAREALGGDADGTLLADFRDRYRCYREGWRALPRDAVAQKLTGDDFRTQGHVPLCVDLESAAVCDLACPFCYRQFIATPDKIMDPELAFKIIDQAADLRVPSMKFNWRGEPLLNPKLPDFIAYAKKRGILETIINTNATELDETMSRRLIDAGLDLMIYSFDGGTKESYEKMRPGRFRENSFERVHANIRRFAEIRREMDAKFPWTRIQMILTEETFAEQNSFHALFDDCVDDVSVKQYTERGAQIAEFDESARTKLSAARKKLNLDKDATCMRDANGDLFIATGRLPCEQPYQRLLVTYDGRVGMCCYDWGAKHPVGYVDDVSFTDPEKEYRTIVDKARASKKGFEGMAAAILPETLNDPQTRTATLEDIWYGAEIDAVRLAHAEERADEVAVCATCPFKDTYRWEKVT